MIRFVFGLFALLFASGWVPLVVWGALRRRAGAGGQVALALGVLWGLGALSSIGLGVLLYREFNAVQREEVFSPATYEGPLGVVRCPWPDVEMALATRREGEERTVTYRSAEGAVQLPAGRHGLERLELRAPVPGKGFASLVGWFSRPPGFVVDAHEEADLPLTLACQARVVPRFNRATGQFSIDFLLTGAQAGRYVLQGPSSGRGPGFEVVDGQGRTVWSGRFAYG